MRFDQQDRLNTSSLGSLTCLVADLNTATTICRSGKFPHMLPDDLCDLGGVVERQTAFQKVLDREHRAR